MKCELTVQARIDPHLKTCVEEIFQKMGLTPEEAITLFYRRVELRKGLPFDLVMPTDTTKSTFEATDEGRDLVVCDGTEDMFERLGI